MEPDLERRIAERLEILSALRKILIEDLDVRRPPEQIDPDTPLFGSGLGLDSVDAVELMVGVHSRLGANLPNGTAGYAAMRTLNTLVDQVISQRREDAP
ncbi:MAG: acyl carrier protein [Deltaproteobacteria bacterium]|jgi:acyl carrier protein|nr:acyl carrier protein [Deltaproteobacteria bacterium]